MNREERCAVMRQENLKNNRDILLETRNLSVEFPLKKKSFFEKNVCHTGTSNGGKSGKWHFFKWVQRIIRVFGIRQKKSEKQNLSD